MNFRHPLAAIVLACTVFSGPAALAAQPEVSAFDAPAAASAPVRFEFARIKSAIPIGDKIGHSSTGMFCMSKGDVRASARLDEVNTVQAALAFKTELANAGLASAAPEVSSFDSGAPKAQPDYRIGGVLQALSFEECVSGTSRKGNVDITVKWEVFAPSLQKVVFTKVTTGSVSSDSFETVNGRDFESRAYSMALRTLLSDPEFRALRPLEAGTATATAPAANGTPLPAMHFKMPAPLPGGSQANAEALRQAVVTVMHDNVSGSGFYVADGYLLTNHHVVGSAHYVKVKLATGRVVVGEVVRDDSRRDAALIKTEPAGVAPLRVSVGEPKIGQDVFAIGSPLGQELAGTFTRGVMSGTRQVNGLDYLQSDVAINPGNSGGPLLDGSSTVIGMAVLKIDKAAGLSFFIPLRDAANALQLVFD